MNDENKGLQESFDSTLKDSDLTGLIMDYSEIGIDSLLADGVLKEIPIVKTVYSLAKVGVNVRDYLFLKKVLSFLQGIDKIPTSQRQRVISEIDDSKKFGIKVGEKLLYLIDSCEDHEASAQIAKLFKAFLDEEIDYDMFLDAASIVRRIAPSDMKWFLKHEGEYNIEESGALIGTGLFNVNIEEITASTREDDDWKRVAEGGDHLVTSIDGGKLWLNLTDVGYCIKQTLI